MSRPPSDAPRIRVALREIHDVAYRALRVAGASSGESDLAARAVVHAELARADGLALLLHELPRVTPLRVAAGLLPGPVAVLDDPARRGLFFAVPAAVECVLADPARPVLVPHLAWRPAVDSLVAVSAQDPGQVQVAPNTDGAGLLVRASAGPARPDDDAAIRAAAQRSGLRVDARAWATAEAAARDYLVPEA